MFEEDKPKPSRNQRKTDLKVANLAKNAPLQKEKEKTAEEPPKVLKLKVATIEDHVIKWMDGSILPFEPFAEGFENNFFIWKPNRGATQILEYLPSERIVRLIELEELASKISRTLAKISSGDKPYMVTLAQSEQIARAWRLSTTRKLDKWPRPIVFKSSPELAFTRLPFDPDFGYTNHSHPDLRKMLKRMKNSKAFCAKIGQMLTYGASRKQVLWIFDDGEGRTGKSVLLEILSKLCGGATGTMILSHDVKDDKHYSEVLVGMSIILGNEFPSSVLSTPKFKAWTGDSKHYINPKGTRGYMAEISGHFVFASNEAPEIPNQGPLKDRIIACKMTQVPKEEVIEASIFLEQIDSQLPTFAAYCIDAYKEFEKTGFIESEASDLREAIEDYESSLKFVFDQCFVVDPFSIITANQVMAAIKSHIDPREGISQKRMREYIKTEHQIQSKWDRVNDKPGRYYFGLRLKY